MTEIQQDYLIILNKAKKIRKERKFTIEQIAKYLNKSKATISNIENNTNFDYDLLFAYCGLLDIKINLYESAITYQDKLKEHS